MSADLNDTLNKMSGSIDVDGEPQHPGFQFDWTLEAGLDFPTSQDDIPPLVGPTISPFTALSALKRPIGNNQTEHVHGYIASEIQFCHFGFTDFNSGSFGTIYQAQISKTYREASNVFVQLLDGGNSPLVRSAEQTTRNYAVKRLHSADEQEFSHEVEVLQLLNNEAHPNIVRLLASYRSGGKFHLVFPWADGDLGMFWRLNPRPKPDPQTSLWMLSQMKGLADGLSVIHGQTKDDTSQRWWGCHWDIKPANILVFPGPGDDGPGPVQNFVLKLCDFGHSSIRLPDAPERRDHRPTKHTPVYRAPELDLRSHEISSPYDIWSFGCVVLEFTTWFLLGSSGLETLASFRVDTMSDSPSQDAFFCLKETDGSGVVAVLKPEVEDWIRHLRHHPLSSSLTHDLLDLIIEEMLVVESAKRSSSRDVYQALARLCQKIEDDSAYSTPHWTPSLQEHCAACLNGFVDCQCLGHEDLLKMVPSKRAHSCKRKRVGTDGSDDVVEGLVKLRSGPSTPSRFGCHFFKSGASRETLSRSCMGPGWNTLHRTKEHIYRCHTSKSMRDPLTCPRCLTGFKSTEVLGQHLREEPQCLIKAPEIITGQLTFEQAANLRSKRRKSDMTDEEKWFEIYQILFPSHDLSTMSLTPYHEDLTVSSIDTLSTQSSVGMSDYRSFVEQPMTKEMQWEMEADFKAMGVAPELFKTLAANFHKYQRKGLQKFEDNKFKPAYGMPVADVVPKADVSAERVSGFSIPLSHLISVSRDGHLRK
ncbi:kinase-like domain-containing protein [Ilyonectria destructans]|nr:kinase-like domain-containing protein [Ilyonectria destructans]